MLVIEWFKQKEDTKLRSFCFIKVFATRKIQSDQLQEIDRIFRISFVILSAILLELLKYLAIAIALSKMAEKVEELALPSAVIMRILKDAIPDGINISREARAAVSRAAAIFVLYITACATHVQAAASRKTLTASDVFLALKDTLFEDMIEPLQESLDAFHAEKGKKDLASVSPSKAGVISKGKRKRSQSTSSKEFEPQSVNLQNISNDVHMEGQDARNSNDSALV